jgi:hypothetical protein
MGPPGSGKSFIGNSLASRGIARYIELEPILVEKFGKGSEFVANKEAALKFIRESYIQQLEESSGPVAIESTGVSDRPLLDDVMRRYTLLCVKLSTPKAICLERVANRPPHLNIGNDLAATARFYDFWHKEIEPTYSFALAVDGNDVERAIREIAQLLETPTGHIAR